jgi:hypothetical protein
MVSMDDRLAKFVGNAIFEMAENKVKIIMHPTFKTPDGCGGSFGEIYEGESPEFEVAMGSTPERWLGVFVHEYAHFTQHVDKEPLYLNSGDPLQRFWRYLEKKRKTYYTSDVAAIQDMERDCERRSVSLIRKHRLPLNIEDYCQQANAQLLFYNEATRKQSWVIKKGRLPYDVPAIKKMLPTKLMRPEWYRESPEGFSDIIDKYCFKPRPAKELRYRPKATK